VKTAFYAVTTLMIILTLLLIVGPLIQGWLRQKQSGGLFITSLAIVLLLPGSAIYLYTVFGTPGALDDQTSDGARAQQSILAITAQSNSLIQQRKQDAQDWMQRARAYDVLKREIDARDAYERVLKIDGNNTAAMLGWVEADMSQHGDYAISASSRQLLAQAIALEPDNQRALWLIGLSEFQQKKYSEASATWRRLQRFLDSGSALAQAVAQQIAIADTKAKGVNPASFLH